MEMAAQLEQQQRDAAITRQSRAVLHESDPGFDGANCVEVDCGEAIPAARLALGKIRCVACQAAREKRR